MCANLPSSGGGGQAVVGSDCAYGRDMVRLLVVLVMTAAGSVLSALAGPSAHAGEAMCGGFVVTIDLNQPGAPDPNRDAGDVVLGTPGDDRIETGDGADVVCAGAGGDVVHGGLGPDALYGEAGSDLLDGGRGIDHLYSSAGSDLLDGGNGDLDDVIYDSVGDATDGVTVDLMVAGRQDTGAGGVDQLVNIDNLQGTAGDDVLSGDRVGNTISGGSGGADLLKGRDGRDHLSGGEATTAFGGEGIDWIFGVERAYGGPGDDNFPSSPADELLVGGPGTDTARYLYGCRYCPDDPGDAVTIDLAVSGPQDTRGGGVDQLIGIENLLTGPGDDVLSGNGGPNRLESQWGDDILNGRAGADRLNGGTGLDTCNGGPGRDHIENCE